MIKTALQESKKLLEYFIDCDEDFTDEEVESIRHFIKALKAAGCCCDYYNGFDCGCGHRAFLSDEAFKELERDKIVKIYLKRLNKYWECSYGAYLDNWSKAGWVIVDEQK